MCVHCTHVHVLYIYTVQPGRTKFGELANVFQTVKIKTRQILWLYGIYIIVNRLCNYPSSSIIHPLVHVCVYIYINFNCCYYTCCPLHSGILANPQWKHFRHMELLKTDQIRLSNGIWRSWYMQCRRSLCSPVQRYY